MAAKRAYLAFDIETAKEVPGNDFNWRAHRPLGITCIASQRTAESRPRVWYSRNARGEPAPQMSRDDLRGFVEYLQQCATQGDVVLTWNGLAFDFDILAEESGEWSACRALAARHVDMMYHVVCEKGFPVGLNNAAAGLNLPGKLAGVAAIDAPQLWRQGQCERVLEYVQQDVSTTLAVAMESERQRRFCWRTQRGSISTMPLGGGWLDVETAGALPLPDTSWMSHPLPRDQFTRWMSETAHGPELIPS